VIGQPKVLDGFITLNVECSCKTVNLLVGVPGSIKCCSNKDCDWAFMMGPTTRMDDQGMHWTIAWQRMPKDPLTGLPQMPQP
jgi:hypothetical protein